MRNLAWSNDFLLPSRLPFRRQPDRRSVRMRDGGQLKHDWTPEEIESIYVQPLPDLVFEAQQAHRRYHSPDEVQWCALLSIKTGGCPEDCGYCPQSAHYRTAVRRESLLGVDETIEAASRARNQGVTRFCMGAAWRDVPSGP